MKTIILYATLCALLATGVAQKQQPKAPPKPAPAKSYDGTVVFRTYVTGTGHKTEMYVDVRLCEHRAERPFGIVVRRRRFDPRVHTDYECTQALRSQSTACYL